MTQKDNILQELADLNSDLLLHQQNPYTIPAGYFDGLSAQVLIRIKAMEADNSAVELNSLSPFLSAVSRQMPYSIPAGYFDLIAKRSVHVVDDNKAGLSVTEELETISPLLSGLKKQMPYSVPAGYFETLNQQGKTKSTGKIIALSGRNWFRYAAAAVITGIIAIAGFLIVGNNEKIQSGSKVMAKFTRDVKKMNETQKDDLIDFIDAGMTGAETVKVNTQAASEEVKNLLKDVSDEELKDFQEQTEDVQDVLTTNE